VSSILIAGIGNIFLGDDGFGCEVARRLSGRRIAKDVRVQDFGIRGLDLAFALMDSHDATILIDAMPGGGEPGTIYVLETELDQISSEAAVVEAHTMDPIRVLALARSMGAELKSVLIVGCEPETFGPPDEGLMGLSACVTEAVERAIEVVESLVLKLRAVDAKGVTT
jgi:hydrogenase maturation protease